MAACEKKVIGIIVGSQRKPRSGLQIAEFVLNIIQSAHPSASLKLIDLAEWDLPLFNEPGIPSRITSPELYVNLLTRRWSAEIASCSAFIFVTPQYNGGYPASLKNAIDYLYHEWNGKPAMIVTYGARGGGMAADALKLVFQVIKIRPSQHTVSLQFPGQEFMARAFKGENLSLQPDGDNGIWHERKAEIVEAFEELNQMFGVGRYHRD